MILGGLETIFIIGVARYVYKNFFTALNTSESYRAPLNIVSLVGAASSGKSSLGNSLLGIESFPVDAGHGTTDQVKDVVNRCGVTIRDTPGIMDEKALTSILTAVKTSRIVIYVALGELYRPEFEILNQIHSWQVAQNALGPTKRKIILFVNKQDVARKCMTSKARTVVEQKVKMQITGIVNDNDLLFGCARNDVFSLNERILKRTLHDIPLTSLILQINSETTKEIVEHAA
jgi:small GTP-binding protein